MNFYIFHAVILLAIINNVVTRVAFKNSRFIDLFFTPYSRIGKYTIGPFVFVKLNGNTWKIIRHFVKGANFCDFLFAFRYPIPSENGTILKKNRAYSQKKGFAPFGSKSFLLRIGPFLERKQNI